LVRGLQDNWKGQALLLHELEGAESVCKARGSGRTQLGVEEPAQLEHRSATNADIVHWDTEPEKFVAAALGPATVVSVAIESNTRTAHVRVPKGQLSLAIGRDGQNARLAAKLTGWRVDIKSVENGVAQDQT